MAVDEKKSGAEGKVWGLCKMPFWQSSNGSSSSSSSMQNNNNYNSSNNNNSSSHVYQQNQSQQVMGRSSVVNSSNVSSMAKSLLPTRRRLRLDPSTKLFFPYEPGKQVRSAISIKNTSKSHVAFKFQTTAPKSCYMRPPGGILAPGESLIATVFKFVEPPENNERPTDQKSKVKFKIMSLKVKGEMDYVPELALDKLKRQLAEADAALEARKKPPEDTGPRIVGEGLVIDEWKERRERYLARQQVEGVDSV
ncbi:hypothetical protein CUMW_203740 [Citrus unshiu]|uniref:MSP domain-containing protein n=1 Tax=Citrus unshiu TaxID=55188 RepID=A0A2H5Q8R6_CITUN|nr:hypothetical protein CUMW_203740 [Citrus unshiu]